MSRAPAAAGLRDILHAEWTKLRTVAGPGWLLAATAVLTAAVSAAAAAAVRCQPGLACRADPGRISLTGVEFGQAVVAILAVQVISRGFPPLSLADGPVLRAAAGSVLYLALIALLSLGIATIMRDSAAATGLVLALLYLAPVIARLLATSQRWHDRIERYAPMPAGLAIQATRDLGSLPISPWRGLAVLTAWAAGALLLGGLALRLRDA